MLEGACLCGQVTWRFDSEPDGATACNCSACRRYGALWIYGYAGEDVHMFGATKSFQRRPDSPLSFNYCPTCGCITDWKGLAPYPEGHIRQAVNLRLALDPQAAMSIPIDHFDGAVSFKDLPKDGKCVRDLWF
jgi:hypothetical protein